MQERKKIRRMEGGAKEAIEWRGVPCNRFREGGGRKSEDMRKINGFMWKVGSSKAFEMGKGRRLVFLSGFPSRLILFFSC